MKLLDYSPLALLWLGFLPWLLACGGPPRPAPTVRPRENAAPGRPGPAVGAASAGDPHSFARPNEVVVEHVQLNLSVDFTRRRIAGRAGLRLRNLTGADRLYLDTRDLDIQRVTLADGSTDAPFTLGEAVPNLGRPLEIRLPPGAQWVNVDYATRPEAAALQWLTPEQAGSPSPFLFTQSEAILARTWVPCQDSPGVRITYEATVAVPPGLLALMSAENPQAVSADGVYRFAMRQPIPSYLLALAVGDLSFRAFDRRSGVYALPAVLERAARELADTPRMIDAAVRLYGPYKWGRYDLLVLPASYPYGGMENPRLTFVTPTILAGDRSLVSLVAHELAHSWSGNLVTNATWNDFWLNEGFTVYFEWRIMEALNGKEYADMLRVLGRHDLEDAIRERGEDSPDTHLFLNLAGRDPDEATSEIAYQKGALFLTAVEQAVGRERFDRFLRGYFDAFAFQSMDTARFLAYLHANLLDASPGLAARIGVEQWVFAPGLPAGAPRFQAGAFARVDQALAAFARGTPAGQLATAGWNTQQWLHFLHGLPASLRGATGGPGVSPPELNELADLDGAFHFTSSGNAEILADWLQLAIQYRYEPAYPALESFLTTVGRRKFLKPLYGELVKTPDGTEMALRIYARARPTYHSVSQAAVDKILDWRG
jgi:leukotriene-A4 hydrolase